MKAVMGISVPAPILEGQKSSETGYAASSQITKTGTQPNTEEIESLFIKCLTNSISQVNGTKVDNAQTEKTNLESANDADGSSNTSVISGLIAQFFAIQSSVNTNETEEGLPEGQTAITADLMAGEAGTAVMAAQFAVKEKKTASGSQDLEVFPETFTISQNDENIESVSAVGQVGNNAELKLTASCDVIQRNTYSGEQGILSRRPEQSTKEDEEQKNTVIIKGNITENIIKTLTDESKDGKTGQTFQELFSDKEKPASDSSAKENNTAGTLLTTSSSIRDAANIEKSQAVEKAVSRFLDDFRSAETGKSEIQIVLEPENLGTLTISVSHTDNGISAKIKSEDREICALISNQIEKLIHSMESKGVTVENVDVVFGGTEQNLSFANSFSGRQEQPTGYTVRSGEKEESPDGSGFFNQWQVSGSGGILVNGTIEYRIYERARVWQIQLVPQIL